ncbi:glycosyltransferase [Ramlibacter henchirensis]|uniref:Glycosyltransferase n=1 Tax=Ramlibacter henchirensis TaxID=204072 RepID=A0A4Z0BLG5_9BURK|nr:glycosyltransferase [Ramlibacter henchirensis]TFY99249.1 glycosyltransferase [Ramlibacter henchirensis]
MGQDVAFGWPRAGNDYSVVVPARLGDSACCVQPISMVVPTYNRAEKLERFLAAATHLYKPVGGLEIVVADDGSGDNTAEVIRKFEDRLNVIHVRQRDAGHRLSAVCNLGVRAAKHDRIVLLQSDMLPSRRLLSAYSASLEYEQVLLIGMRRFTCTDSITAEDILRAPDFEDHLPVIQTRNEMWIQNGAGVAEDWRMEVYRRTDYLRNDYAPFRAVVGSNLAFRREAALRIGGFCESFQSWGGEDGEFGYRAYLAGFHLIPIPAAVAYHQEPPEGINETDRRAGFIQSRDLREQLCPLPPFRSSKSEVTSYAVPKVAVGVTTPSPGACAEHPEFTQLDARVIQLSRVSAPLPLPDSAAASDVIAFDTRPAELLNALACETRAPYLVLASSGGLPSADSISALVDWIQSDSADALLGTAEDSILIVKARAWNRVSAEVRRFSGETFVDLLAQLGGCLNLKQRNLSDFAPTATDRSNPVDDTVHGAMGYDLREILRDVLEGFRLRQDRTHGVGHWARVWENGRHLAKLLGASVPVVELFAILHDSQRDKEGADPDHGPRAAAYAIELARRGLIRLAPNDIEVLAFACEHHSKGTRDGPLTAQVCWDADRLDLGRVGVAPLPSRLCTKAACESPFFEHAVAAGRAHALPNLIKSEWGLEWQGSRVRFSKGVAELGDLGLIFHGTQDAVLQPALERGFRFRRHEATLTFDLVSACLIFANQAHHANREMQPTVEYGRCLALQLRPWIPAYSPTAYVWASSERRGVYGGMTKWIGGYVTPYKLAELTARDKHRTQFVSHELSDCADWKRERSEHVSMPTHSLVAAPRVTASLESWLRAVDEDFRCGEKAFDPGDNVCSIFGGVDSRALFLAAYRARASRYMRRLLLSLLAARNIPLYRTDVTPWIQPRHPFIWDANEVNTWMASIDKSLERRGGITPLQTGMDLCLAVASAKRFHQSDVAELLVKFSRLTEPCSVL